MIPSILIAIERSNFLLCLSRVENRTVALGRSLGIGMCAAICHLVQGRDLVPLGICIIISGVSWIIRCTW